MDRKFDPVGTVLRVRFEYRERLGYSKDLDFFRTLEYDHERKVVGAVFLAIDRGINLEGVPRAEEIADAIGAFRAATTPFQPAVVKS
jgi:hypothetical protein